MNNNLNIQKICAAVMHLPLETVKPASRLIEDLGANSLDLTDIAMRLEDELGLVLTEAELLQARTPDDLEKLRRSKAVVANHGVACL